MPRYRKISPEERARSERLVLEFCARERAHVQPWEGAHMQPPADLEAQVLAAYWAQMRNLKLAPGELPPCIIDPPHLPELEKLLADPTVNGRTIRAQMFDLLVDPLTHNPVPILTAARAHREASRAQTRNLRLKPWQSPPADVDEHDPNPRDRDAQALRRRMLAAGVDPWEHDPLAALAAADDKPRRRRRATP